MERNGTETLLLKKDKHGYYKKVASKKNLWSDKRLVENIRNEVAFLEQENGRQLEEQEVKLVMLVNLLNYMEDSSSVEDKRHKEIKKIIDNNKLLHSTESEAKKMNDTKNTLQLKILNNSVLIITNDNYKNALKLGNKNGKAFLNLVYNNNELYLEGLKELTKAELKEVKSIDLGFLNIMFTLCYRALAKELIAGGNPQNIRFEITTTDLYEFIHKKRNLNKRNKQELINKMKSYNNITGVIKGENGGDFSIFLYVKYLNATDTITFESPYFELLLANILNEVKKKKSKNKNFDLDDFKTWYTGKLDAEAYKTKDKIAVELAERVLYTFVRSGKNAKKAHISIQTLEKDCFLFAAAITDSNDVGKTLRKHFTNMYKILWNYTDLKESWELPCKDVDLQKHDAMIPNKRNYKTMVLEFYKKVI